jgi:hypothetical protein
MANDTSSIADLTIEVLKEIREDIRGMRGDISEMRGDIRTLTGRFDHFLEFGGKHHGELEARVERLEEQVFGSTPR